MQANLAAAYQTFEDEKGYKLFEEYGLGFLAFVGADSEQAALMAKFNEAQQFAGADGRSLSDVYAKILALPVEDSKKIALAAIEYLCDYGTKYDMYWHGTDGTADIQNDLPHSYGLRPVILQRSLAFCIAAEKAYIDKAMIVDNSRMYQRASHFQIINGLNILELLPAKQEPAAQEVSSPAPAAASATKKRNIFGWRL
ncbi:MAG: hypothetical protein ACOYK8_06445 [Alphaproteobacteria bacterium]